MIHYPAIYLPTAGVINQTLAYSRNFCAEINRFIELITAAIESGDNDD